MLKPLKNEWTVHPSYAVRLIYRDGRIHAALGHPREHCPWSGAIPYEKGQQQWRPEREATKSVSRTMRRRAWLAGWDKETALMKKAAEDAPRRPVIDEDDV